MTESSAGRMTSMLAAGFAGGAAEVLWIGVIAAVLGVEGTRIAAAVATTVLPAVDAGWAPWIGLAIHFLFSFVVAAAFVPLVARRLYGIALLGAAIGALGLVWVFNFFVLLPLISPSFVGLLPLPVTLVSKLLFGLAMGAVIAARLPVPREYEELG